MSGNRVSLRHGHLEQLISHLSWTLGWRYSQVLERLFSQA
jgi:hypothetical protein